MRVRLSEEERKEKRREYERKYYKINRDIKLSQSSKWRALNPEKMKLLKTAWRSANKERIKLYNKEYNKNNPDKARTKLHNKRARKKLNGGKLSENIVQKLLNFQKGKCAICRKSIKKPGFHLDHIVPLSKGGKNADSNAQLTCPTCNLKKGGKDPIQFMQSLGYLL